MKRKILSTILAGALILSASAVVSAADTANADLFAEGFESTTAATGGAVDTNTVRTGSASYVVTEDGTGLKKLEIPVGEAAEAWVGKMLVAEAWYHIDGALSGYSETTPEGAEEPVISGEQVTMAFYKDAETVNVYKNQYNFQNAVWPNTNTEGWYRIRTTGIIESAEELDLSGSKLVIGLTGAAEGTKLYVDDVRIFVTDNIVDMCTQGNSDFDTYDHTSISGWTYWQSGDIDVCGTVEYSKEHPTSGQYGLKYTRKLTAVGEGQHFGLYCDVPLGHFGAPAGEKVIMSVNSMTNDASASFWKRQFIVRHDYLNSGAAAVSATGDFKTSVSEIFTVPEKNANTFRIITARWTNVAFDTTTALYFDDAILKVVPGEGFSGLKKSATSANETEKSIMVDSISHGDTVYPYAYFAADQAEKVTLVVARYSTDGAVTRLDDVSVHAFDTYTGLSFDTNQSLQTTAITVPAEGEYTYKIMTWGDIGGMNTLLDTAVYEVK